MRILEIKGEEYDSDLDDLDTGIHCRTEKVVDITENCPNASQKDRVILLFTRTKRGRIVQISRPYEGEAYRGLHINFFIDELDKELRVAPDDNTFDLTAKNLGLSKWALHAAIEMCIPV